MPAIRKKLKSAEAAVIVKQRLRELPERQRKRKVAQICKEVAAEYGLNWKTLRSVYYKRKDLNSRDFKAHGRHRLTARQRYGLAIWAVVLSLCKVPLTNRLLGALEARNFGALIVAFNFSRFLVLKVN